MKGDYTRESVTEVNFTSLGHRFRMTYSDAEYLDVADYHITAISVGAKALLDDDEAFEQIWQAGLAALSDA